MAMARSWIDEGLMVGNPPAEDRRVTLANYDHEPYQRWSVINMRQLIPSALVKAPSEPTPLPRNLRDLTDIVFEHAGVTRRIDDLLADTYVDAMIVVHRDEVVFEHYDTGVHPDSRHIAQSVTKSFVGTLTGILIHRGLLVPDELVTTYLPELRGTSWDGATGQQLLDMRTGTRRTVSSRAAAGSGECGEETDDVFGCRHRADVVGDAQRRLAELIFHEDSSHSGADRLGSRIVGVQRQARS
jgi:CubicO group peptidase (beta-lactamase class C family)